MDNRGGKRPGAGRKATGRKTVQVTLTLSPEEKRNLLKLAEGSGLSVSRFISQELILK